MVRVLSLLLVLAAGALSACNDVGGVDTPLTGRLSWFAFLGGKDIRDQCRPGEPARYRFVYNAVFDEQVRSYDLVRTMDGASLDIRVPPAGASPLRVNSFSSEFGARARLARTIDVEAYRAIARQLEADGFGAATQTGNNFPSWDFYWIVSACAEGRYHVFGWRNGTPEFAALKFPALLFAQDKTGVPVNPVRANTYGDYNTRIRQGMPDLNFDIQLSPNGLANGAPLF
ncbi:MAG: hypothetical protein GC202_05650 [Alphaproteobacteria bacterium]|nr:hypothetical protein [Alphaproteobacteria bacterium]